MALKITKPQWDKMISNGKLPDSKKSELKPVIKLFGGAACTWLLSEL